MSVIIELRVPADGFVLDEAMAAVPQMTVDLERFIPADGGLMPFLWATGDGYETFEDAIVEDSTVEQLTLLDELNGGGLFQVSWGDTDSALISGFQNGDEAVLRAVGQADDWFIKIRFGDRESLSDFQTYCEEENITFNLLRLYETVAPKLGQYDLSVRQRDAIITAFEMGYFDVPRQVKLADVADKMDLSPNAVSERIRRGEANLFRSALTISRPPEHDRQEEHAD